MARSAEEDNFQTVLFCVTFVVVGLDPHLIVPTLATTVGPHEDSLADGSPNGFVRLLLFRVRLALLAHPFGVDIFLFKVIFALGGTLAFAALSLQSVFLSGILVEFGLR